MARPAGGAVIRLVDVGNTRLRWATPKAGVLDVEGVATHRGCTNFMGLLTEQWGALPVPQRVAVSCVAGTEMCQALRRWCERNWDLTPQFVRASPTALGVVNGYDEPERLGSDRWLALIAARRLCGSHHACVVDCGTAVTVDWLHGDGRHLGGFILPGRDAMIAALARETSLAMVAGAATPALPRAGASTDDCVSRGTLLAISGAIESAVAALSDEVGGAVWCVLSGGSAQLVASWLSVAYRLEPNVVLDGLALWAQEQGLTEGVP
ncbi:MAG: hypothetical protein AMJ69_11570 [Gammaproteobacteria bacterium SG8_47]|nr:MAG: hypothetical protein AMJ69_11570 [Gammaproteobacteria bacterium SG8_47]